RWADLRRGAEQGGGGGRRRRPRHAHPRTARRVARLRPSYRSGSDRRGRLAPCRPSARVDLRADSLRRGGRRRAGFVRLRPKPNPHRAVRTDREIGASVLDGNAIAGILEDIFGEDMTTTTATCSGCGRSGPLAETAVYVR